MNGKTDALAALKIWGCQVEVAGHTYEIPPMSAAEWFRVILGDEEPLPIVPGLFGTWDRFEVMEALLVGETSTEELVALSREVLEEMAGTNWWAADRMIRGSAVSWRLIGGELVRLGVDMDRVSLAAALNAIYVICVRTLTEQERNKFELDLFLPPVDVDAGELVDDRAADVFLALLGPPPVPPPAG